MPSEGGYALIEVGCLECGEWSSVRWFETDEVVARARFQRDAQGHGHPDCEDLIDAPSSLVLAAGSGGSYYYALQLHRMAADA